jgi:protoheme ferro-lyase
LAGNPPT